MDLISYTLYHIPFPLLTILNKTNPHRFPLYTCKSDKRIILTSISMKRKGILAAIAILLLGICSITVGQDAKTGPSKYSAGISAGYNRGLGFDGNFTLHNFTTGFPFEMRFGIGYASLNPGNALDARRIFVNNNTNGTPEKKGRSFDFRFDLMVHKTVFNIDNSFLVFGPRFSTFMGDFKYVGGNEDFEVTSKQWGGGAGIEHQFRMLKNLNFIISYGLDFYFPSTLTGHDTSYSPDNDNVNVRTDNRNGDLPFTYRDADRAIAQPRFMPRLMLGINVDL